MPILEHQYHPVDYRNVCDLRKVSYAARALYLELFCAAGKTTHGVVDVRPALLEEESGIPGSQIPALLVELVTAGLIAYDAKNRIAYHAGSALRHCDNAKNRNGWIKVAAGLPAGPVKMAFESELAGVAWQSDTHCIPYPDRMDTVSQPSAYGIDNSNSNDNWNSNNEPSVAKATDTSAIAAEPADDVDTGPWAKLAQEYSNPTANRPDFRIAPTLTPEAALRLAKADAARKGILPPEPQQLAMDLPAGKPKRELTDGQLDAIFAKKRLKEVVDHWNEVMASKNAPCDFKSVAAKATVLVGNLAKYKHRDCLDDARCLFDWSVAVDKYHSGQAGKLWTLQGWLSAEHLSAVFAAYRQHRGDAKMLTMDLDRTIRHWRLEVEAGELNNKLAAAKNEAA